MAFISATEAPVVDLTSRVEALHILPEALLENPRAHPRRTPALSLAGFVHSDLEESVLVRITAPTFRLAGWVRKIGEAWSAQGSGVEQLIEDDCEGSSQPTESSER